MANFVTEDDKRIFDLQPIGTGESISDYQLVLDKTGNSEAKRITIPNFINRLFPNLPKQRALSGNSNPDNASGTNGDFYFKVTDNSLTMYEKVSESWSQVFTFSIPEPAETDLRRVFLIPSADITDGSINLTGRENQQGDTIIPSDANVSIYEGGKIVPATYYENGLIEGLDGSLDVKVVLIGSEPVAPVVTYKIINESSINGEYQFSNSDDVFVVSAGQEINIPYQENVSIIINLLPGQYENYKVTDENGNIIEDRDSAPGPSISIGFPMNSTQSQLFTIKNDA